jgi:hypothetical protein
MKTPDLLHSLLRRIQEYVHGLGALAAFVAAADRISLDGPVMSTASPGPCSAIDGPGITHTLEALVGASVPALRTAGAVLGS